MDGILNIRKEKGFTSHDVVAVVRRILHIRKVGHTGTLDPDAEGVLPICVGKATKLSDVIMDGTKSYRAMVRLGITTTTEDAAGEIIEEKPVDFDTEKIQKVVLSMIGEQEQIPPMYSAIKVNGKKLYELAREGKTVERRPRMVQIFSARIRSVEIPRVRMEIRCSKGTYIRTLCHDIGAELGCGGCMESLERTQSGAFSVQDSLTLDEVVQKRDQGKLAEIVWPVDRVLERYPRIVVSPQWESLARNGGALREQTVKCEIKDPPDGSLVRLYGSDGQFIALYAWHRQNREYRIKKMFFHEKTEE